MLISFAVAVQVICAFDFAYAKIQFSQDAAQIHYKKKQRCRSATQQCIFSTLFFFAALIIQSLICTSKISTAFKAYAVTVQIGFRYINNRLSNNRALLLNDNVFESSFKPFEPCHDKTYFLQMLNKAVW